ncbi:hypothetical protein ADIMK_3042 [Marinobacterium lacunae]|uniref:Uncharacterized protein n=1 Tax=Marinobacterium lacunae TaxID=1232683 RepID=A0A081FVL5_9GAMM|nr:hypothetical protein [Marinobacterium lacunae]KEA62570.1 hypothetical protein ADIMK_3042 [Marinobacterium lacunae]
MKTTHTQEDPVQALNQFEHLAHEPQSGLGRGLARIAMLLAAGRYCRHRHLSISRQSTFQRNLMENHHEY